MLWINKEKTFKVLIIFNKSQSQQCTNRNRFHWNWKNSTISLEFSLTFPINQSSECSLAPNPNPISLSDSGKTFSLQFSFLSLRSTFPFHRFSYLYILNSLTLKPCLFPENLTFFFFFPPKRNYSFLLKLACQISWNFHSFRFYNFVAFSAAKHIVRVSLNSVTFCCWCFCLVL